MNSLAEYVFRCQQNSDIAQHLPRLHQEASRPDCVVIELGVRSGNSTVAFLAAVEAFGGIVHSVDINQPGIPWWHHPQWFFHQGDDLNLAGELPDCDVLFIDTSHWYEHTRRELDVFVPKVRPGGVVLLHDTELESPAGAPSGDPPFPVRAAVDGYVTEHGLNVEYVTGCYGLGVIHIGGD